MHRILVVNNIPSPNNDGLYRLVSREPGVDLLVAYSAASEPHRVWQLEAEKGYAYLTMRGHTFGVRGHFNPEILAVIRGFSPTVAVVSGSYTMPTMHLAAATLKVRGVPWVYWGEALSHDHTGVVRHAARSTLRQTIRAANAVFAIGTRARESYIRIGVAPQRVADFRYYADNVHFALDPAPRERARATTRALLGCRPGTTVYLFCGQLVHRKRVDTALHAFAHMDTAVHDAMLVIAGEGQERDELFALAERLGIAARVRFVGFVPYRALPAYFAASDALVLPSEQEGWGLVVPEALAAGVPVLASDRVNAAADLVRDGEAGWIFPVGDADALADGMHRVREARPSAHLARNARAIAERESPERAAPRMVALLARVAAGRELVAAPSHRAVS